MCKYSEYIQPILVDSIQTGRATNMVQVAKSLAATLGRYAVSLPKLDAQLKAMVRCIKCPGGPWDIGLLLTTDEELRRLNKKYRNKDRPTDILSFPFHKISRPGRFPVVRSKEERYLGDMYISVPYVQRQCDDPEYENITTLESRMPILLAHGVCHMMGYDHETDEDYARMMRAEAYILKHYPQYLRDADHKGQ